MIRIVIILFLLISPANAKCKYYAYADVENNKLVSGYPNDRPVWKAGDDYFFHNVLEAKHNMKHITVFNSLVYHIQEGEKDE